MGLKPVVFFSHSSRDEALLRPLKSRLLDITAGTVDIFLSSDGQSIPLGRNWVSRIEEALKHSAVMFVFLTPNSVSGHWLYFEAGFSYARNIRVVPVALPGLDLDSLGPPISLLQGFNVRSQDSLNNIVAVINEEFSFTHPHGFTEGDFTALLGHPQLTLSSPLGIHAPDISSILVRLRHLPEAARETTKATLASQGIPFQERGNSIHTHGLTVEFYEANALARLDPTLAAHTFPLLDSTIQAISPDFTAFRHVLLLFSPWIAPLGEHYRLTSRLFGTDILLNPDGSFSFRDLTFSIEREHRSSGLGQDISTVYLEISEPRTSLAQMPISELLETLFSAGALPYEEAAQ